MQEPAYQIHSIRAVFFQFAHDQLSYQGISLIEKSGQRPMSEIAIFRQLTFFDTKSEPTGGLVALLVLITTRPSTLATKLSCTSRQVEL